MSISQLIKEVVLKCLKELYGQQFSEKDFQVNQTKPEFEGDYTVVLFSLVKKLKKSPEATGNEMGAYLVSVYPALFTAYNIIKGFLNMVVADEHWLGILNDQFNNIHFGWQPLKNKKVVIEYSSPNTNKPLHLGHLRNNFLGWSIAEIFKANGYAVTKTCIVNDRGIHICKSMLAWQLFADGATPTTTNTKGDHFVGLYYVKFNEEYKKQVDALIEEGLNKADAEKEAPLMKATQQLLLKWEEGDPQVRKLWHTMNSWVYIGFDETYKRIGSDFDKVYYESNIYLDGKKDIEDGLARNVFFKKDDGSIWIDLTAEGLDEKLVLRKDGTAVYITQDIALATKKYEDYKMDQSIFVIGDEQNYHVKVLKLICMKLGMPYADQMYHLSYGMVELTTGKMKSREGTVVDADDLIAEMVKEAEIKTLESGKAAGFTDDELTALYEMIGIGAMKFYLLRVEPKKKMIFNPAESIDLHGFTATAIQYTHARIKSILRTGSPMVVPLKQEELFPLEKELMVMLEQFADRLEEACKEMNPSVLAIYTYEVAKKFNSFYDVHSILKAESEAKKDLRLRIAQMTSNVISSSMGLLGIRVPERM